MIGALVAGLALGVGSAAHCAGMCGPLAALACASGRGARGWAHYLGGRLLGYGLLGAAVGTLYHEWVGALRGPWPTALTSWALSLALATAALQLWRRAPIAPPRRADLVILQRPTAQAPRKASAWRRLWSNVARWPPALVGAMQTLLPCGALAAAVVVAATQGSALAGASAMLGFATTSSLGLLAAGLLSRRLSRWERPSVLRGLSVALAVGAALMLVRPIPSLRAAPDATPPCPLHAAR